jgi:hypothetical protein
MDTTLHRLSDITTSNRVDLESREFTKFLSCYALTGGATEAACRFFLDSYPGSFGSEAIRKEIKQLELHTRAASAPGMTSGATWAQPLVGVEQLASGFLALAYSSSLLGRIPGLRRIPFETRIPVENTGASYAWVTEGGPKPVAQMSFGTGVTISRLKSVGIVVFSAELIRQMPDGTEAAVRDTLIGGLTSHTDTSFLSTSAAVAATSPAGILAGLTPVTPGANFAASIDALLAAFFAARPSAQQVSLIAGPAKAAQLRTLNSGAGVGHDIVITSAAGTKVIALDGTAIYYADGGFEIDVSQQAAIQMNSTPDNPSTSTTVLHSLWQNNLLAYKVERYLNWWAAPTSVQFLA